MGVHQAQGSYVTQQIAASERVAVYNTAIQEHLADACTSGNCIGRPVESVGINLYWSKTPSYEWQVAKGGLYSLLRGPVRLDRAGLPDPLVDPRRDRAGRGSAGVDSCSLLHRPGLHPAHSVETASTSEPISATREVIATG